MIEMIQPVERSHERELLWLGARASHAKQLSESCASGLVFCDDSCISFSYILLQHALFQKKKKDSSSRSRWKHEKARPFPCRRSCADERATVATEARASVLCLVRPFL